MRWTGARAWLSFAIALEKQTPGQGRLERAGRFPKRVQLSDNAVGWYEAEVLAWNENRPRAK